MLFVINYDRNVFMHKSYDLKKIYHAIYTVQSGTTGVIWWESFGLSRYVYSRRIFAILCDDEKTWCKFVGEQTVSSSHIRIFKKTFEEDSVFVFCKNNFHYCWHRNKQWKTLKVFFFEYSDNRTTRDDEFNNNFQAVILNEQRFVSFFYTHIVFGHSLLMSVH